MKSCFFIIFISFQLQALGQTWQCDCPTYEGGIFKFHKLVEESLPSELRNEMFELLMIFDTLENEHHTLTVVQNSQVLIPKATIRSVVNSLVYWNLSPGLVSDFQWRQVNLTYTYPTDSIKCEMEQAACLLFETYKECTGENDDDECTYLEVFELFDVSERARFRIGHNDFVAFIDSNMIMPLTALNQCIPEVVNVMFVVETDGSLSNIETLGAKQDFGLEEEALRLINLTTGMWTPAKQRDKKVRMRMRIPINFEYCDK